MAIEFDKSRPALSPVAGSLSGARASEPRAAAERPGAAAAAGDAVTLTGVSGRIRELLAEAGGDPPIDQQRVEALRAAIAEGSYRVDSQSLAERLLQREEELFK